MATNYYDNIIERLIIILKTEFKNQLKFYKFDKPDIHSNSLCLIEGVSENQTTWAPNIVVDRFPVTLILRHVWQSDHNRVEFLNRDFHKIKCAILAHRSDTETYWFNGLVTNAEDTIIEEDAEGKATFFRRNMTFSCLIAYDYTEGVLPSVSDLSGSTVYNFVGGDTTPSVSEGYVFNVPAAVTITNFDDPPTTGTKLIEVIAGVDNVIIEHDASKIKLIRGVDVLLNSGDSMFFRYISGVWVERVRSLL